MQHPIHALVIGINYNSDEASLNFGRNLQETAPATVQIILVDNTNRARDDSDSFFGQVHRLNPQIICLSAPTNLGYFGGANFGLTHYLKNAPLPEWVIVSNVDIEFRDKNFFSYLYQQYAEVGDVGVIAPSIWSEIYHKDSNPHILKRLTSTQIQLYQLIFRFYPLALIYSFLARAKSSFFQNWTVPRNGPGSGSTSTVQQVYAPQGACILFSKTYFLHGGSLNYPAFLFQEEIFVAEETRQAGLKAIYDPKLEVSHDNHVSTGHILSRKMARYYYESTVKIAELYY